MVNYQMISFGKNTAKDILGKDVELMLKAMNCGKEIGVALGELHPNKYVWNVNFPSSWATHIAEYVGGHISKDKNWHPTVGSKDFFYALTEVRCLLERKGEW